MNNLKQVTEQILSELKNEGVFNGFNSIISVSPTISHGDTNIVESFEKYNFLKELLINSIENGTFEDLPLGKRNSVLTTLTNLKQYSNNGQQLIVQTDALYDVIMSSGLLVRQIKQKDYQAELKNISNLKTELQGLVEQFRARAPILSEFDSTKEFIHACVKNVEESLIDVEKLKQDIITANNETARTKEASQESYASVLNSEKEIETKKLSINTFAENIDEYKDSIEKLSTKASEIIAKEAIINDLIGQAETALNLKSAEGISAAFSAQYADAGEKNVLRNWIIGASLFIIIAIALTIWIVSGKWIADPNSISSIIGRIVAVGISITGATFCAKQYNRQKNIADDYAYKAVLAKSIIAFTEEIKKRDDQKVAEYLAKVLDEIHKDPLRSRSGKDEGNEHPNPFNLIEKLVDKIPAK